MAKKKNFAAKLASPFIGLGNFFKNIYKIFQHGTIWTKLSFLILGISNLVHKQVLKGLLFLATEILFILFMLSNGIDALIGLVTLGTKTQGWVFDEDLGIDVLENGDNSMLMLIYGIGTILIIAIFIKILIANIKSANKLQKTLESGSPILTLKHEASELLDRKFHITLLSLPVLGVLLFTILPLIFMILIAFTNYDSAHQPPGNLFDWVGVKNFFEMFSFSNKLGKTFTPVLVWTFTWAILATASTYICGIILALMINKKGIKFKGLWRTIFVLTIAIPQFISLLIMRNMFSKIGPINQALSPLLGQQIPFLEDANIARIVILCINLWVGIPYTMLITSGILMNIPKDIYESAKIDGASSFVTFFKITLPYIMFVTAPYLITQFIGNINNFNIIYLLIDGGPPTSDYYYAGKTDLLITWLYRLTVNQKDYNIASTIGICVFLISVVLSLMAYKRTSSYEKEGDFAC
ncbi:MAG: sugar ABC transporter permease [Oscillospiraceae bacterium]|jgi:arabinogalactan oligomer/maltooligosaccharide transport system permease protein|nr:sugar ABC transporter permease [Oscillospiraceae bacterium]